MSDTIQVSRAEMLALKATLLSLQEALDVTRVALDKALAAKAEEAAVEAEEAAAEDDAAVAAEAEEALKEALAVEKAAVATPMAKAKKSRANAGQKTAWSEWTVMKMTEHKDQIEAYIAKRIEDCKAGMVLYTADQAAVKLGRAATGDPVPENMAKVGAHLSWLKAYKADHEAEWLSFKQQWEVEHPKGSRATSVADGASQAGSVASEAKEEKSKRGRKPMTQEQKDAAKAKREAKKAAVEFDPLASQWA